MNKVLPVVSIGKADGKRGGVADNGIWESITVSAAVRAKQSAAIKVGGAVVESEDEDKHSSSS